MKRRGVSPLIRGAACIVDEGGKADGELRAQMDVTLSYLVSRRDRDCADYCESLTEKAEGHEEKLVADYGITAGQLDKCAALVEAFDAAIDKPESAISPAKKLPKSSRR